MKFTLPLIALGLTLAACSGEKTPSNNAVAAETDPGNIVVPTDESAPIDNEDAVEPATTNAAAPTKPGAPDYAGRWIGVEGMYLNVTPKTPGKVALEMQWGLDADMKGAFDGNVTPNGITFTRAGKTETLRPSDGDATGLKYLAGKKDCLTVASGEGYCRK